MVTFASNGMVWYNAWVATIYQKMGILKIMPTPPETISSHYVGELNSINPDLIDASSKYAEAIVDARAEVGVQIEVLQADGLNQCTKYDFVDGSSMIVISDMEMWHVWELVPR